MQRLVDFMIFFLFKIRKIYTIELLSRNNPKFNFFTYINIKYFISLAVLNWLYHYVLNFKSFFSNLKKKKQHHLSCKLYTVPAGSWIQCIFLGSSSISSQV